MSFINGAEHYIEFCVVPALYNAIILANVKQTMHLHSFAPIFTYAVFKKHAHKQINMENIYMWPKYLYSRLNVCIYSLHICIYSDLYPCIPTKLHIYMQHKTPNHLEQATGAAKSCSKHNITAQESPPEATVDFYQETSR